MHVPAHAAQASHLGGILRRLEDPAAQPPYLPFMVPPVHTLPGVTIERGRPSGPFTKVSNVPVSSGIYARFVSKMTCSGRFVAG